MIPWLIWKDLRLTAPVLLAAAILGIAPVLCMLALAYTMAPGAFPWAEAILAGAHFSQWLLLLTGALLGGNAFASEQEDGSFRFLMSLPARPQDVLFSKAIVTLIVFESLWIANAGVVHAIVPFGMVGYREKLVGAASMPAIASLSLMALGLSWFWSAVMARPVAAALSGLLSCGLLLLVFRVCAGVFIANDSTAYAGGFPPIAALLGIAGIILGSGWFLLRDGMPFVPAPKSFARSATRWRERPAAPSSTGSRRRADAFHALAWKDWHLMRPPFVAGTALVVMPYVFAGCSVLSASEPAKTFALASTQSLWLCCPVFAIWGGYLIAVERRTQTDRFLDALPITRARAAASKLIAAAAPAVTILGVNAGLSVLLHSAAFLPAPLGEPGSFSEMTWSLLLWQEASLLFALPAVGAPLICFGAAWLASARLAKPFLGLAVGAASAGASLAVWLAFSTIVQERLGPFPAALAFTAAAGLMAIAGIACGFRRLTAREPV